LLAGRQRQTGFASPAAAFGHREIIAALNRTGLLCTLEGALS
jgi:hypothetical protein